MSETVALVAPHGGSPLDRHVPAGETGTVQSGHPGTPLHAVRPREPRTGFVLWLTGLSGAGKSTLAEALRDVLAEERRVEVLDGDEVRTHLSKGLGFSKADRDTNVRRIAWVARTLARHGVAVITAAISPYRDARAEARGLAEEARVPFLEVFVHAPIETLVDRDVKGLYRKALAGELPHFTGVSDPYEPPLSPDVVVDSSRQSVATSVETILARLRDSGLVRAREPEETEKVA